MKTLFVSFILLLSLMPSMVSADDLVVVANKNNPLNELSKQQIIDIFMGRTTFYASGQRIILLDQKLNSSTRKQFYLNLVNKTLNEINSYRARFLFSGRATLPREVSDKELINYLETDTDAIGYVEADKVNDKLKILGYVD